MLPNPLPAMAPPLTLSPPQPQHMSILQNFNKNNSSSTTSTSTSGGCKRKRRPAGTPDPNAEVVSLSPKTLLESDRYVCEICKQGFRRDQNLQMHRRRHKLPWKLNKRETTEVRKRVFVCPETTCLHHDPCHALGDLVGIKKHFRRKHSVHRQWVCGPCSRSYAVESDYKAHLKICGTRGHSCDCGRVFSRIESFIEHQDACTACRTTAEPHQTCAFLGQPRPRKKPTSAPSHGTTCENAPDAATAASFFHPDMQNLSPPFDRQHYLRRAPVELHLLPTSRVPLLRSQPQFC